MKTQIVTHCSDCSIDDIRDMIQAAGTQIGSVHFRKRSDGSLRKMCYRLHVTNPQWTKAPKGNNNRKAVNQKNNQLTVYDVNKVIREKDGSVKVQDGKQCRGAYRTIPLENVEGVCAGGMTYVIHNED